MNKCKTLVLTHIKQYSTKYKAYDLTRYRSLIKVKGQDSSKYLQNLITNNVYNLNNKQRLIYSMILNNRGRVLYDICVYSIYNQPDEYLLEVDSNYTDQLIKFLTIYKIKKKVEITNVDNCKMYAIVKQDELVENKLTIQNIDLCELDPRCSNLGYRAIDSSNDIISKQPDIEISTNLNEYKINLYKNGIAENGSDISYSNSIPLEYNIALLNGVSFDKGCYLGQELIAKTHHTGVIRKRITPIKLKVENISIKDSEKLFKQDNQIINIKTGKQVGKLRNIIGKYGIAMLRITELDHNNLVLVDNSNGNHLIDFNVPDYWSNDTNLTQQLKEQNLL